MSPPPPMNPNMNFPTGPPPTRTHIEHMPPNPNATNPLPTAQGHTLTGELHPRKADGATPTQLMLHTHPCSRQPCRILPPPYCSPRWQGKGPRQSYPSPRPQA
ncbi:hypothetical protein XENORESO_020615 [Xenotaenia resolanae]|uniref:Uncharacterized protein n=1 Tax=Xenotaenia resolanae TaxID=208358 RepID=A0ABV0WC87_9TELE